MEGSGDRSWVKTIGRKLRVDLCDQPTLPDEFLRLLSKLKDQERPPEQRDKQIPLPPDNG